MKNFISEYLIFIIIYITLHTPLIYKQNKKSIYISFGIVTTTYFIITIFKKEVFGLKYYLLYITSLIIIIIYLKIKEKLKINK